MIIQTSELNESQLNDLDCLCERCKKFDGNLVSIYRHLLEKSRGRPASILYYLDNKLVGFLAAFFFRDHASEIGLMVEPESRRIGIATQMMQTIMPLLQEERVKNLLFSSPHELNNPWFLTMGLQYQNTEYRMVRDSTHPVEIANSPHLTIRLAKTEDMPVLFELDQLCFPGQDDPDFHRFCEGLNSSKKMIVLIEQNDFIVGKAHINWQDHGIRLSDIAVHPHHQRQGFGQRLLAYCINFCVKAHQFNLYLDVETNNKQAIALYSRLGFRVDNAVDNWHGEPLHLTNFIQPH